MTTPLRVAAIAFILGGYAPALFAYSAVVSVHKLLDESDLVVVAEVLSVTKSNAGAEPRRLATARVLETWKGPANLTGVEYIASPSWFMCDTSNARVGETVVLFLSRDPAEDLPRIAHFGRGRMPIRETSGSKDAYIDEVVFPRTIPVRRHTTYPFGDSVPLEVLKAFVRELTAD